MPASPQKRPWEKRLVNCRSCGQEIFFIPYKGKVHPVNSTARRGFYEYVHADKADEFILATFYESHFSTCPQAQDWRKTEA